MSTRSQKIRLGVFMILALLLFLGAVGTLAGIKMFNPKDRYHVSFTESVSGLEVGSVVKMKGVRVGQVESVRIGEDVESVHVTLAMDPGTPITRDTRAIMTAIGITGLQFVELTGGSAASERIPPNTDKSFIKPGSSTLQTLTGKATSIALKMEGLLNNLLALTTEPNRIRVRSILENTDKLLVSGRGVVEGNQKKIDRIFTNLDRATRATEKASRTLNKVIQENSEDLNLALKAAARAASSLDRAVASIRPQATLNAITSSARAVQRRVADPKIDGAVKAMKQTALRLSTLSGDLSKVVRLRDRQLAAMLRDLNRASEYLKDFARAIRQRPSLLLRGETLKEKDIP